MDQVVGSISRGGSNNEVDTYLFRFFTKICDGNSDDYNGFRSAYEEFENFFFTDALESEIIAPLLNLVFEGVVESIDLGDGIFIRRTPADIRPDPSDLYKNATVMGPYLYLANATHCLYAIVPDKKAIWPWESKEAETLSENHRQVVYDLRRTLECLRLFQPGYIGNLFELDRVKGWKPANFNFGWSVGSIRPMPYGPRLYELGAAQIPELQSFCRDYRKKLRGASSEVLIANRRFNFAYERGGPEDILIDLVIALEALFAGGGRAMALRVAGLLGNTPQERENIFEFTDVACKLRNNVVHGSKIDEPVKIGTGNTMKLASFLVELEQIARKSLRLTLERSLTKNQRTKELQQKILKGIF
jgi:hypothetical protein